MGKRLLISITFLLMAGIVAGWYFFARESRYLGTSPLTAVPVDAPFFVRVKNLGDYAGKTVKNKGWQAMSAIDGVSGIHGSLAFLDSLIHLNKEMEDFFLRKELIFVPGDRSRLYLLKIASLSEKNGIQSQIQSYFQSRNISVEESDYLNSVVQHYTWSGAQGPLNVWLNFYKGLLMVSDNEGLLHRSMEQMDQPSLLADSAFLRINNTAAENADLNVYLNHKSLPSFVSDFFPEPWASGLFQENYARWTEFDVIQKDTRMLINGFSVTDADHNCFANVFKNQKPVQSTLLNSIPANATFFSIQGLSDPVQFFSDFNDYLLSGKKYASHQEYVTRLSTELDLDVARYLKTNWTGEAAVVYLGFNLEEPSDNRFLLLKVKPLTPDPLAAALKKWRGTRRGDSADPEAMVLQKSGILEMPSDSMGILIGDHVFRTVRTKWMTSGDGFVLFGSSPGALMRYRNLLQRGELLKEAPAFAGFASGLAITSNYFMWMAPGHFLPFLESAVNPPVYQNLQRNDSSLIKMENFAWQWNYEKGMLYNSGGLSFNSDANQDPVPFWRYATKAKIRSRPVFVTYSARDYKKDLVFQDVDNFLTDLDSNGTEHWRIHLEGPILGEIKSIDYFKNGNSQLLFNTKDAIHLIGSEGSEIKRFPVRLRYGATNEIAVVDYDGKREYRYLVACKDRKLYNFDKTGKVIPGWQARPAESMVEHPVRHFRVGSKDYILFFDRKNTYVLDRQGKERIKVRADFVHSGNDFFLIAGVGGAPSLVTTDEHGKIWQIGLNGTVSKTATGEFSAEHFFTPLVAEGQGNSIYLFLDRNSISSYDQSGNQLFHKTVTTSTGIVPLHLALNKEQFIGFFLTPEGGNSLVRADGSLFNLRLPASCNFQNIGQFNDSSKVFHVVVTSQDGFLSDYQMKMP